MREGGEVRATMGHKRADERLGEGRGDGSAGIMDLC